MKLTAIIIFSLFYCVSTSYSQSNDSNKQNAVSFELGKNGLVYNLTFDHRINLKKTGFRFIAGSNFSKNLQAVIVGGSAYYLFGKTNHFFETGADLSYLYIDETSDDQKRFVFVYPDHSVKAFYPSLNLGYRRYGQRTLFRIGFSPGIIQSEFVPGGYVSYGFRF